jgi:hypothetical protein
MMMFIDLRELVCILTPSPISETIVENLWSRNFVMNTLFHMLPS